MGFLDGAKIIECDKKYRVVTFQSAEVVREIMEEGLYYADPKKSREGSFNDEDFKACEGNCPIWVFQHPAFKTTKISAGQWCEMLQVFRQEMSISSLDGLFMIELLLDKQPPIGKAHNASSLACIIPRISIKDVAAIYVVAPSNHWYFYTVCHVWSREKDILFPITHMFTKDEYKEDDSERIRLASYNSAADYYKY